MVIDEIEHLLPLVGGGDVREEQDHESDEKTNAHRPKHA
jgi:hypothetical protein